MKQVYKSRHHFRSHPTQSVANLAAKIAGTAFVLFLSLPLAGRGQHTRKYDLSRLLVEKKLFINPRSTAKVLNDSTSEGVTCSGIVWVTGVNFQLAAST